MSKLHFSCFITLMIVISSCTGEKVQDTLFKKLPSDYTGVRFSNPVTEDETHNILNFTNLYTGSGVGIGDFNNDGLEDVFLGGNMVSSALYLNKGDLRFTEITEKAGVETDRWVTGVSVVDINQDGLQDVYLSVSGAAEAEQRRNLLFVNQGGEIPNFKEEAQSYGLADTSQVTHTAFFDYDRDGDLDAIMVINPTDYELNAVNTIRKKKLGGEASSTDRLYRNNGDGTFTDVSREAGILIEGYSLGVNVSDLTGDNWPDIYVTNDFLPNDILYVNNQDGTFTNKAADLLRHTSFASMGVDVSDFNNDAEPDIYVADMFPEDNYRQKMIMSAGGFDRFYYILKAGYEPQYSRNVLQKNNGNGTFSEIGQLLDVHQTDWSWSVLFGDYDNDGWRDLLVTNGFRRDLGSLDYINYGRNNPFGSPEAVRARVLENIKAQPGAQISNYVFRNEEKGEKFEDKTKAWGLKEPSYSHGAAYADLDNDGDLDLVINNVSQEAFIYENQTERSPENHFLQIILEGDKLNRNALGTKITLYCGEEKLYYEHTPYRGYESTLGNTIHFGLGSKTVDYIELLWPNDSLARIENLPLDTLLNLRYQDLKFTAPRTEKAEEKRFASVTIPGLNYTQKEDEMVDFKIQSLLPHQHSMQGPCLTKGDINGDGMEDIFIGGAAKQSGIFFVQQKDGSFSQVPLNQDKEKEDTDASLFDADADGDLDLFVVSGGTLLSRRKEDFTDCLYLNDGQGSFTPSTGFQSDLSSSGSTVITEDFNGDGAPDIFVAGYLQPGAYPQPSESALYLNDGKGNFSEALRELIPDFTNALINDAVFSDFDGDGDQDLIVVGEWMSFTIYENTGGIYKKLQLPESVAPKGWWSCVRSADIDGDGDSDYLLGNLGLNSNLRASPEQPLRLYADDYDQNGSIDPVLSHHIAGVEVSLPTRDQLIAQMPAIKGTFTNYASFANADFQTEILPVLRNLQKPDQEQIYTTSELSNGWMENLGQGKFTFRAFPQNLQTAPLKDFLVRDFNADNIPDILVIGNSFATEVNIGRYDAFNGAYLSGKGDGTFTFQGGPESGFYAPGDTREMIDFVGPEGENYILVGRNSDGVLVVAY